MQMKQGIAIVYVYVNLALQLFAHKTKRYAQIQFSVQLKVKH